jgi:phenylacetic acid degradation operon negative regulatory protein
MSDALTAAAQALLRRLHDQQPLRGGSLIITIFGDAIAPRGGVITLGSLIRVAGVFRLTERLVRTSVARLANEGWLAARKEGRQSEYRLAPAGEQRFAEATRRIYGMPLEDWGGQWTLVMLPPGAGTRAREELRWLGFGQLSAGTFAHPSCTLRQAQGWLEDIEGAEGALCLRSSSSDLGVDRQLVARGWDLGELARRYRRFVATFAPLDAVVRASARVQPEDALVIRTLLIHQYRKIHLQDPLLPAALLPDDWIGAAAYELTRRLYSLVFADAEQFLSATARTVDAPLPPAERSAYERFGGVLTSRARPPGAPRRSAGTGSRAARPGHDDRSSE